MSSHHVLIQTTECEILVRVVILRQVNSLSKGLEQIVLQTQYLFFSLTSSADNVILNFCCSEPFANLHLQGWRGTILTLRLSNF